MTAMSLYKKTLRLRKKVLSQEHPQTLASMNNLARLFHNQGKYEAAKPLYDETLRLRKKVLGPTHPDTLASINNLTTLLRYQKAELLNQELIRLSQEIPGQEYFQTLGSMNQPMNLLQIQGNYKAVTMINIKRANNIVIVDIFDVIERCLTKERPLSEVGKDVRLMCDGGPWVSVER